MHKNGQDEMSGLSGQIEIAIIAERALIQVGRLVSILGYMKNGATGPVFLNGKILLFK